MSQQGWASAVSRSLCTSGAMKFPEKKSFGLVNVTREFEKYK